MKRRGGRSASERVFPGLRLLEDLLICEEEELEREEEEEEVLTVETQNVGLHTSALSALRRHPHDL